MAALSLKQQALAVLGREKPHSSITDLIEILTSPNYEDEAFDGIPELVESINVQPTGPAEASRAIRKKLKHGDSHRQYRALVLLKATVENGGERFQTTFADGQLMDAIKHLVSDLGTDPKVKRKLISVLGSWRREFEGDPRMSLVANLYKSVPRAAPPRTSINEIGVPVESEYERRKREEREAKEEAKKKAKEEKRRKEEEARQRALRKNRAPFDFEKEKPQVLQAIAETSQASNNLVNALTLVNPEHENVQDNARVKECLEIAKQARKRVIRYIQLVENEELIGTLLETNERVIAALQMYDKLIKPTMTEQDVEEMKQHMAAAKITDAGEVSRLQEKQRVAVARQVERERERSRALYESPSNSARVHPDLHDLSFGGLDAQGNLPPPMRPDTQGSDDEDYAARGSLSDFSDYDSSDEETHKRGPSTSQPTSASHKASSSRPYANDSDEDVDVRTDPRQALTQEDPFADPFGDQQEVSTPDVTNRKQMDW